MGAKALRTAGLRYIAETSGRETLHDLTGDPGEYHSMAADPPYTPALAELRVELLNRLIGMERPIPHIWPY